MRMDVTISGPGVTDVSNVDRGKENYSHEGIQRIEQDDEVFQLNSRLIQSNNTILSDSFLLVFYCGKISKITTILY